MNPREHVDITRVVKRGEWYTVEGTVKNQGKASVEIPAHAVESKDTKEATALFKRGLFGSTQA